MTGNLSIIVNERRRPHLPHPKDFEVKDETPRLDDDAEGRQYLYKVFFNA